MLEQLQQIFVQLVTILFDGISIGSVLLLAALGLAIVFGLMGVINLAHGELIMLGAYTTFVVQNVVKAILPNFQFVPEAGFWSNAFDFLKSNDMYIFYALPMAFIVGALVGLLLEREVIRYLYGRPLETLLATWGVSLILRQFVRSINLVLTISILVFCLLYFGAISILQKRSNWEGIRKIAIAILLFLSLGIATTGGVILSKIGQEKFTTPWFGSRNLDVTAPKWLQSGVSPQDLPPWLSWLKKVLESVGLGNFQLPSARLFIIFLTLICILAMYWFLNRSNWGLRIRSVTQNRDMSACLGIPTRKVDAITFAIGSGLAGIAGCAITLIGSVGPNMGGTYIVDAFMVVVVGGVGKIVGSLVAAIAIGTTNYIISTEQLIPVIQSLQDHIPLLKPIWKSLQEGLALFGTPSMAKVLVFAFIITFLQVRPAGLFPQKGRTAEL